MTRFLLNRITLIFTLVLAFGLAGGLAYQVFYVQPEKACVKAGNWWAEKWRTCATPIDIKSMPIPVMVPPAPAPAPKQP